MPVRTSAGGWGLPVRTSAGGLRVERPYEHRSVGPARPNERRRVAACPSERGPEGGACASERAREGREPRTRTSAGGAADRSRGARVFCEPPVRGDSTKSPGRATELRDCRIPSPLPGLYGPADSNRRLAGSPPATFLRPSGPHHGPTARPGLEMVIPTGHVRASSWSAGASGPHHGPTGHVRASKSLCRGADVFKFCDEKHLAMAASAQLHYPYSGSLIAAVG
jgi:hypothetical protein